VPAAVPALFGDFLCRPGGSYRDIMASFSLAPLSRVTFSSLSFAALAAVAGAAADLHSPAR